MPSINPYESPREAGNWRTGTISPEMAKTARNIRAICILYIVLGAFLMFIGIIFTLNFKEAAIYPLVGIIAFITGCAGLISAIGVLRKCSWGVPVCMIVSAFYLLNFPIGTILGAYFLINIGKVKKCFVKWQPR
jgi:hypothetical protein